MGIHARLSASTTKRWMNCAGSVRFIEDLLPDGEESSVYGEEGTAAHKLGSDCLTEGVKDAMDCRGLVLLRGDDGEYTSYDPDDPVTWPDGVEPDLSSTMHFVVDDDMADAVNVYLDVVADIRAVATLGGVEGIEVHLDMTWLDPDFGGTADYTMAEPFGILEVVDYKHGKGVVVEVEGNTQLRKYAVGALRKHPDCDRVRIRIVQPRKSHPDGPVRSVEYTRAELEDFARELVAAAEETRREDAPLRAGPWCRDTFCPVADACPELAREVKMQTLVDFDDDAPKPGAVDVDTRDLSRKLPWVPVVEYWCTAVKAAGQAELERGGKVDGFKLVHGKPPNRAWALVEEALVKALKKLGLKKADMYTAPKLKSPAQMEKTGRGMKKRIEDAGLWERPEGGKLTIAPDGDPREAVVRSAAHDFEEDE